MIRSVSIFTLKSRLLVVACLLSVPAVVRGQGFGVYEHGACMMGRGTAGVAEPCDDGSAIYVNPAVGVAPGSLRVSGGVMPIFGKGRFTADSGTETKSDQPATPVAHGYVQRGLTNGVTIGAAYYFPYGLALTWPTSFGGRYLAYDSDLRAHYLQPSIAYRLHPKVSIGGGAVFVKSSLELARRENLAAVALPIPGTTFGWLVNDETDFVDTRLTASAATGFGGRFGVQAQLGSGVHVGARYLTPIDLDYSGTAAFTALPGPYAVMKVNPLGIPVGAPLTDAVVGVQSLLRTQEARTSLTMPGQFTAGISVRPNPTLDWKVFGDYQWVGWSAFDVVTLDFQEALPADEHLVQNYDDTSAVLLGTEFVAAGMRIRGGYSFNQAAAPDESVTPLLPEARRQHISVGIGFRLRGAVRMDVAYKTIRHADRRGRIVGPAPGAPPSATLNSGTYSSTAHLFAVSLSYRRSPD